MADDKPDPGDTREGGGPAAASMTINVWKADPDTGQWRIVQARIVGPREQMDLEDDPLRYPVCVCRRCTEAGPAPDEALRSGE